MTLALVTGGAGFIGSHIVEGLLEKNYQVRVVDNLCTGNVDNLKTVENRVDFHRIDINDVEALEQAMQGVEIVFHQAALASVPLSLEKPLEVHHACVTGTLNVLNVARESGVRKLVYAASSSCYGDKPFASKREIDELMTMSPYAAAKLAGEFYCRAFFHSYGLETVGIRYFNVFGPRQDPGSPYSAVIPLFITWMLNGQAPVVYGDGLQSRDFTFVKNVVQGNLLAAEADGVGGEVFNVANGKSTDLLTLISLLNRFLGTDLHPVHEPARVGDIRESMADISLASKELKYQPTVGFEEGLQQSIDYYRNLVVTS
ncbi:MAG: SDR family oxidoreductase [Planctomycetota bacterium]|nr:SDR family oxidoreductase [Planctomycetota bacterium]